MTDAASLQSPRYPSLQHLYTRGTFYDVGYNVGVTFSRNIHLFKASSQMIQEKLLPFYDSRTGREYFEESLKVVLRFVHVFT